MKAGQSMTVAESNPHTMVTGLVWTAKKGPKCIRDSRMLRQATNTGDEICSGQTKNGIP